MGTPDPSSKLEFVVFIAGGDVLTHALPSSGRLVIGRAEDVDIRIDDPTVSRHHAELHVGGVMHIQDLDSANGTGMRSGEAGLEADGTRRLRKGATFAVEPGACIVLGSVMATIRKRHEPAPGFAAGWSERVVVRDPAMRKLYEDAHRIARSDVRVLILGETGVGKEVLARAIHDASGRAKGPFVAVNCAALTKNLVESELFGHVKGSFTGAIANKQGVFEAAHGGTLFLDELGELSADVQAKLLRAIEEGAIMRVGDESLRRIDVRFIAATNRDLEAEVSEGTFRRDVFFRLEGVSLTVPPLCDRPTEIVPLAKLFLEQECRRYKRQAVPHLSEQTIEMLMDYAWPGNIRELRNAMQRAGVLCAGNEVVPEDLPPRISGRAPNIPPARRSPPPTRANAPTVTQPIAETELPLAADEQEERQRIVEALGRHAGSQTSAAKDLGVSRRTLVSRLEKYGIPRPRK